MSFAVDTVGSIKYILDRCKGIDYRASTKMVTNFADYVVLPDEMHELCMKNNPTDENYYIDHDAKDGGYRLVFLNTSDKDYHINPETGLYDNYVEISKKQEEWIKNEVLNTNRKVIVFSHVHADNGNIVDDLPTVTTLCSLIQQMSDKTPSSEIGKYTETAFDVYSVKGDKLYITRFGAGEDRVVDIKRANNF